MTAYADFAFYGTSFLGTAIAQADFSRLALNASVVIDMLTFDRAAAVVEAATDTATIEKIQMATCAVAETLQSVEQSGGSIQSERVGNYSVTYQTQAPKAETSQARDAAKKYLWNTGLMYRGLDED